MTKNHHHSCQQPSVLRIIVLLASVAAAAASSRTYTIAGVYETHFESAISASRIDLDQAELADFLAKDSDRSSHPDSNWAEKAKRVYEHGAHSGPYAVLKLTERLAHNPELPNGGIPFAAGYTNDLNVGVHRQYSLYRFRVIGGNSDYETPIEASVETTDPSTTLKSGVTDTLLVRYPWESSCNIDGNLDECFAGPSGGLILQGYGALDYTYDPSTDNRFATSLQSFSEDEGMRMVYCEAHGGCGNRYPEFQRFFEYYGLLDYGHHWIESAFAREATAFRGDNGRGNTDFALMGITERNAAISTATVAMNVFTAVNRFMVEEGVDACNKHARDFSSYGENRAGESIHASWDKAVATYAGSALVKDTTNGKSNSGTNSDSNESGSLYFHMVESLAAEFGVLERSGDGAISSAVNNAVMEAFRTGREALSVGDCEGGARGAHREIIHKMRVPWIQGVLKAAFVLSREQPADTSNQRFEEARGSGASYLAALLPDLHQCSPTAADAVYREFRMAETPDLLRTPDYGVVRDALEHQYQCLSVTCDDVGGYLNPSDGNYFPETKPCGGYGSRIGQRRDTVAYDSNLFKTGRAQHKSKARDASGRNYAPAAFGLALLAFGVSLAAVFAVVNEQARRSGGRPIAPGQLVSAIASRADYWMSGMRSGSHGENSHGRSYEYVTPSWDDSRAPHHEVQLRSLSSAEVTMPREMSSVESLL